MTGNLKIKAEHYKALETACKSVVETHTGIYQKYQEAGLSDMRFNWDVLRASQIDGVSGITWICSNLYGYLNDSHIGSALARILGNTGNDSKGKR